MNKLSMAIMFVALLGGGFAGMAMMGVIDVPGLSPAKRAANAAAQYDSDKSGDAGQTAGDSKPGDKTDSSKAAPKPGNKSSSDKKTGDAAGFPESASKPAAKTPDKTSAKNSTADFRAKSDAVPQSARPKPKPTSDPEQGCKKAAKLWNEMSVDALVVMTKEYKGPDLARILALMDTSKVAKVLEKLATDTKRSKEAAALTKAIQKEASKLKPAM